MAISFVTGGRTVAEGLLEKIQTFIDSNTDATLAGWTSELLDFDEEAGL
jgi:uncharacterized protein YlxP (DUF503 family)